MTGLCNQLPFVFERNCNRSPYRHQSAIKTSILSCFSNYVHFQMINMTPIYSVHSGSALCAAIKVASRLSLKANLWPGLYFSTVLTMPSKYGVWLGSNLIPAWRIHQLATIFRYRTHMVAVTYTHKHQIVLVRLQFFFQGSNPIQHRRQEQGDFVASVSQ